VGHVVEEGEIMFSLLGSERMLRRCLVSAGILLAGSWATQASADSFTLLGNQNGGSAEIVTLSGTANGTAINQGGVISDILDWQDTSSAATVTSPLSSGLKFQAYCIDVLHDIGIGNPYTLNVGSLASASTGAGWAPGAQTAIQYLFGGSHPSGLTPVPPGGIASAPGTSALSDGDFQSAIWAIIYDYNNLSLLSAAPTSLASGLSMTISGGIDSTAAQMAWQAVQDSLPTSTHKDSSILDTSLEAMYLSSGDSGQQQIFLTDAPAPPSTPLPPAYAGGLILFGMIGVVTQLRRTKSLSAI
jgi:hypothetical protein